MTGVVGRAGFFQTSSQDAVVILKICETIARCTHLLSAPCAILNGSTCATGPITELSIGREGIAGLACLACGSTAVTLLTIVYRDTTTKEHAGLLV